MFHILHITLVMHRLCAQAETATNTQKQGSIYFQSEGHRQAQHMRIGNPRYSRLEVCATKCGNVVSLILKANFNKAATCCRFNWPSSGICARTKSAVREPTPSMACQQPPAKPEETLSSPDFEHGVEMEDQWRPNFQSQPGQKRGTT